MKKTALIPFGLLLTMAVACGDSPSSSSTLSTAAAELVPPPPQKIFIWVNAFIPNNLPGSINISQGTYNGKVAIPGPLTSTYCYLTDNRLFSSDVNAGHRMQSLVEIDLQNFTLVSHKADCDNTVELRTANFSSNCDRTASAANIRLSGFSMFPAGNKRNMSFMLVAGANNPCVTPSPEINWQMPVSVEFDIVTKKAIVHIREAMVEPFPAFEMYARVDNGAVATVFNKTPNPGATPWSLPNNPDQEINTSKPVN